MVSIFIRRMKSSQYKAGAHLSEVDTNIKLCTCVESKDNYKLKKQIRRTLHTPSLPLLSSHSCFTFVPLGKDKSNIALGPFSAYLCYIYPTIKITVDNSEGSMQVVCHKICYLNLYSFRSKWDQSVTFNPALPYIARAIYVLHLLT